MAGAGSASSPVASCGADPVVIRLALEPPGRGPIDRMAHAPSGGSAHVRCRGRVACDPPQPAHAPAAQQQGLRLGVLSDSLAMGRLTVLVAMIAAALSATLPAQAAAAPVSRGDAAATAAYLRAQLRATREEASGLPEGVAALEALGTSLQRECPGVLSGAPGPAPGAKPSASAVQINEEIEDAALGVAQHPEYRRLRRFAVTVSSLRWSNLALTRLVHSSTAAEAAKAQVPLPDLCGDLRAWVSSGYHVVSAATASYLRRESPLTALSNGSEESIMARLARYETPADKRTARQIAGIQGRAIAKLLPKVLAGLGRIAEILERGSATAGT